MDDQVKIMAFRIDLLEVENILNNYQAIQKAVILTHSSFNPLEQFLIAFIKFNINFNINDYIFFQTN